MCALEKAFENNALLRSCDEEQRSAIFDAMFAKNVGGKFFVITVALVAC